MQSSNSREFEPFLILHNHRKTCQSSTHSKEHKRQPKDYSSLPHSIILTRRMAAELETKQRQSQKEAEEQERRLAQSYASGYQSEDSRDFFEECSLSRGIPVEQLEEDEAVISVNEPSPNSNYSKLERTLFGLGLPQWDDEAEQIHL